MEIEKIGKDILDAAFAIHSQFGSGLLEKAYRVILAAELRRGGHIVEEEKSCGLSFHGTRYENMFRVDLLVDDMIVVELKSVCRNEPVFAKQCLTYLRFLDKRLGFVINFGMSSLKDGIQRVVNNLGEETSRTLREPHPCDATLRTSRTLREPHPDDATSRTSRTLREPHPDTEKSR